MAYYNGFTLVMKKVFTWLTYSFAFYSFMNNEKVTKILAFYCFKGYSEKQLEIVDYMYSSPH